MADTVPRVYTLSRQTDMCDNGHEYAYFIQQVLHPRLYFYAYSISASPFELGRAAFMNKVDCIQFSFDNDQTVNDLGRIALETFKSNLTV